MKNIFNKLINFFNEIAPPQGQYSWFDKLRVSIGVGVTILVIAFLNHLWGDMTQDENMVTAVFGVSALCIFLFPDS
jgi:CBS domain-containing membrane protein